MTGIAQRSEYGYEGSNEVCPIWVSNDTDQEKNEESQS